MSNLSLILVTGVVKKFKTSASEESFNLIKLCVNRPLSISSLVYNVEYKYHR